MTDRENGSDRALAVGAKGFRRAGVGGETGFNRPLNPPYVPNPAVIGLGAIGVVSLGLGAYYTTLCPPTTGWFLVSLSLFLFAGAAAATLSLKLVAIFAAVGFLMLALVFTVFSHVAC